MIMNVLYNTDVALVCYGDNTTFTCETLGSPIWTYDDGVAIIVVQYNELQDKTLPIKVGNASITDVTVDPSTPIYATYTSVVTIAYVMGNLTFRCTGELGGLTVQHSITVAGMTLMYYCT